MKKKFVAALTAAVLVMSVISGCGKENKEEAPVESPANEAESVETEGSSSDGEQEASADVFTIKKHHVSCIKDGKEEAIGSYPEIVLPSDYADKYPKLKAEIDEQNAYWETSVKYCVNEYAGYEKMDFMEGTPFESDIGLDIVRADDRLFSVLINYYDETGGAHPSHSTGSLNIDPVTGRHLAFEDVLEDVDGAPEIIKNALYEDYPDLVEEFESYLFLEEGETTTDVYRNMLMNDTFTWTLLTEGLRIYYSPYEVASYAAGYLETLLSYSMYPGLVQDEFIPDADLDKDKQVVEAEQETETMEYDAAQDTGNGTVVPNYTWDAFTEDGRGPDDGEHIDLTKISEEKTDWLDTGVWADDHGFTLADLPYGDSDYYYVGTNPMEYDYMYNSLEIYDADQTNLIYNLDLYTLCNGPDQQNGEYSATTQFIRWAKIYDGTLYVSLGHNGYASEEPRSSYMVAIAPDTGTVLWRSQPQVANGFNFQIVKDTIICGYGFTAEDDYIFLLDRFTGQIMDAIPVNSAPYQFEVEGDTLYVACYNTAYEFDIDTK